MSLCETYYRDFVEFRRFSADRPERCFYDQDYSAWYLFQLHLYSHSPCDCDLNLCARVVPLARTIWYGRETLELVDGFRERFHRVVTATDASVDSYFGELLVALRYARECGPENTSFREESQDKANDLVVKTPEENLQIEVKRRAKDYEYYRQERNHWARLASPVRKAFQGTMPNAVFRIHFHRELGDYEPDYLITTLVPAVSMPDGIVRDDSDITISKHTAQLERTRDHLREYDVRADTSQLTNLLFDYDFEKDNAIAFGIDGGSSRHPFYVSEIRGTYGLIWRCDAPTAIDKHARSLKKLLAKSVRQLPEIESGIVHFILETYEGGEIDDLIFSRLNETLQTFDFESKHISNVYLHVWKPRVPPYDNWIIDEDVYSWESTEHSAGFRLTDGRLLAPE